MNRGKSRYCEDLTHEENAMLDIIADIIAGYVMRKHDEEKNKTDMPHSELNQHSTDSESFAYREKMDNKKALDFQALSVLYPRPELYTFFHALLKISCMPRKY